MTGVALVEVSTLDHILKELSSLKKEVLEMRGLGDDQKFPPFAAAEYLNRKESTLRTWRCTKQGPKYRKHNGQIYYTKKDLDAYKNGE